MVGQQDVTCMREKTN